MKKAFSLSIIFCFLFFIIFSPLNLVFAQDKSVKRIAVLDLYGEGISDAAARTLTGRLRSTLVNTNAFHVLEREQMDAILNEQGFQQSGCVSDECLVEIGRLVGVEQMVGGTIGKIGSTYTLDLRIIDVQSGRIIKTVSDDYRGDADGLLEVLEEAAVKIAGKGDEPASSSSDNSWLYWVGAGVLAVGVTTAVVLSGGNSGSGSSSNDLPEVYNIWPPNSQ